MITMWAWQPTGGWSWEFPPMRARLSDRPRKKGDGDDGDTVLMIVDRGMNDHAEEPIRLVGVFAPESNKAGGREAATFTAMALAEVAERAGAHGQRWPFVVVTQKVAGVETSQRRSMARWAGTVYAMDTGECLNEEIAQFLSAHPEWGGGTGAKAAHENG